MSRSRLIILRAIRWELKWKNREPPDKAATRLENLTKTKKLHLQERHCIKGLIIYQLISWSTIKKYPNKNINDNHIYYNKNIRIGDASFKLRPIRKYKKGLRDYPLIFLVVFAWGKETALISL